MADRTWTTLALIAWTQGYFARSGVDAPRLTAEVLLAHALGCDRVRLYLDFDKPIGEAELARYRELVKRRAEGEPTAYLTGVREFYGRSLLGRPSRARSSARDGAASSRRPWLRFRREARRSTSAPGPAASPSASRWSAPTARVLATDLSAAALQVARDNGARLGATVEWLEGDLFAPLDDALQWDVIASNPPYVPTGELATLSREVLREPAGSLDGGADGLDLVRRLVPEAIRRLRPSGTFLVEIHESHAERAPALCREAGFASAELHRDLAGLPRFVVARAPGA